jgi:hypothetical protein
VSQHTPPPSLFSACATVSHTPPFRPFLDCLCSCILHPSNSKQSTGPTYTCHANTAEGGETGLVGSISYAGSTGKCRVSSAGKCYYISSGFSVLVSTVKGYKAVWASVEKAIPKEANLPTHAVKAGQNKGGGTYICRVASDGGETNVGGSVSFSGSPGHCRVAVSNAAASPDVGYDLLIAS